MSFGGKMMHKIFPEILVCELIIHSQEKNVTASGTSRDRPSPNASQHSRMEVKRSQHCPSKEKQWRFHVFSLQKQRWCTLHLCRKYDVGLHSELLQEEAYAFERESLDTKRSVHCDGARQIISLYSAGRKHLLSK
jgi:hypothetical protein